MVKSLDLIKVLDTFTIREAIQKMDAGGLGFICIVNAQDQVVGVVSNGDFRRSILKGVALDRSISAIMNPHYRSLTIGFTQKQALELVTKSNAEHVPVLDGGKLVGLVNVEDFLPKEQKRHFKNNCDVPLVIMAGGQGTRLAPFTHILPKLLMPIGGKPVIDHIISEFESFGIQEILISVNHKARLIKAYFQESGQRSHVHFFEEDQPLGTAGSMRLMKDHIHGPFFMTNCDVLIRENYWDIYDFHQQKGFDLTIVAASKQYVLPYGVCHIHEEGDLDRIEEKPELRLLVNTGVYVISPAVLDMVPQKGKFDMDELIARLRQDGRKVGVFPVEEKAFIDIGQLDEYKATLAKIGNVVDHFVDGNKIV